MIAGYEIWVVLLIGVGVFCIDGNIADFHCFHLVCGLLYHIFVRQGRGRGFC